MKCKLYYSDDQNIFINERIMKKDMLFPKIQ